MQFAQNLKKIMQEKNVTNYRLAKILGVHPTTIKNWLESNTEPKFEMIDKIAEVLEVSTACLIGVNDQIPNKDINENLKRNIDEMSEVRQKMYNLYNEVAENPIIILQFLAQLNHTGRIKIARTILDITQDEKYTEIEAETTDSFTQFLEMLETIDNLEYTTPDPPDDTNKE